MCHVKSSYAFRTVKLLFIPGARGAKRREDANAKEESESEKRGRERERLARADVTIWPPRIHYEQNYEVITALVAKTRRLYTNANECGSVSGLTMPRSVLLAK